MKAFAYVVVATLIVIGIGVGVLAATGSTLGPFGTVSGQLIQTKGSDSGTLAIQGVVTFTNVVSGSEFSASSGPDDRYLLAVPPGSYNVTSVGDGKSFRKPEVTVKAGRTTRRNLCFECLIG
jgi:hypothetical protein